jgi:hypothetical protein
MLKQATTSLFPTVKVMRSRIPTGLFSNNAAIRIQVPCNNSWYAQTTQPYARIPSCPAAAAAVRTVYTAPKKEGFAIPAQGFLFVLLLIPVALMTTYEGRYGPTEETLEEEVGERYAGRIAENRAKRSPHMAEFFQKAIHQPQQGTKVDDDLHKLLYAGKGGKKRMHAIDEKFYGTAEGVAEKTRQEEQRQELQETKRKIKAGETVVNSNVVDDNHVQTTTVVDGADATSRSINTTSTTDAAAAPAVVDSKSLALVAVVATVAATAGFLAGGNRR